MKRNLVVGVLAATIAALVAGCSGSTGTATAASTAPSAPAASSATTAEHNAADTAFVQGMIPHHAQAIQMSGASGSMGGMDHSNMGKGESSMPMSPGTGGMMTDQQMQQFGQASGTAFDRMFLQMMTEHHNGAIDMARTELAAGQNPDAKALAQRIIDAQQAEITEMQNMLSTL